MKLGRQDLIALGVNVEAAEAKASALPAPDAVRFRAIAERALLDSPAVANLQNEIVSALTGILSSIAKK